MTDRKTTRSQHLLLILATLSASVIVAGCGSNNSAVGSGVKPSYLVLFPSSSPTQTSETEIFECEEAPFKAYLYFTDGSVGDFTDRVVWTSASPGTAAVSNGDLEVPYTTNLFYSSGVVLPTAGGTTIISADYQGIKGSIRVDISTPTNFALTDANYENLPQTVNYDSAASMLHLGSGTTEPIKVTAFLDGLRRDITTYAYWSFDNGGDPGSLTVNSSGVLTGVAQGGPQTLRVAFPTCDTQLTQQVVVSDIKSLTLTREYSADTLLIVGNSEELTVLADLGSGNAQDVSQQVVYTSGAPESMAVGTGGALNIVTASEPTVPVTLTAKAGFAEQVEITSNSVQIGAITGTLDSFTISPPVATLTAGSIDSVQFTAEGVFGLADGSTTTQDVTRLVSWGTDGSALAAVSSSPATAGLATSTSPNVGVVTITATAAAANTTEVTATLQLQ